MHASGHILNVNSRALELAGLLRPGINHDGIPLGPEGLPTGELKGPEAMTLVGQHVGFDREVLANDEPGLRRFARLCVRRGVTTLATMVNPAVAIGVAVAQGVLKDPIGQIFSYEYAVSAVARILLVEDQPIARLALHTVIDARPDMKIVAETGSARGVQMTLTAAGETILTE